MKEITEISKSFEFLSKNQKGKFKDLKCINYYLIRNLEKANFLELEGADYKITQEGIDYYAQSYVSKDIEKRGLFGILPRLSMIFR